MNWADGVVLAVILLSVIIGIWRGLVREVLGLAGLLGSAWLAWQFGGATAPLFERWIATPSLRLLAASAAVFVVAWVVFSLTALLVGRVVHGAGLALADRALGGVFGALRGLLICVAAVLLAAETPLKKDAWWVQSRTVPRIEWLGGELVKLLPASWRERVQPAGKPQEQT